MQETFWNLYARLYDRLSILQPYEELQETVLEQLGSLPPNARILDAASGTGYLFMKLVERYPLAEIFGIERSVPMARQARRKLDRHRSTGKLGYRARILELDLNRSLNSDEGWKDDSFDAIVSVNTLYALSDPEAFLLECRRLLAPEGRFVIVNPWVAEPQRVLIDHIRHMLFWGDARMIVQFILASPEIAAVYAINMVIAQQAKDMTYHFYAPEELKELVEKVGFTVRHFDESAYAGTCCLVAAT